MTRPRLVISQGCVAGSILSTLVYAHLGRQGVCVLGAGGGAAILFWTATKPRAQAP